MFDDVTGLKISAVIKIGCCICMGILCWNLASQPQILRDLLLDGDSQILPELSMDVGDSNIIKNYYERYRFVTRLIGFAITSQATSYGVVTLYIPEMGYSLSAASAITMSALGAFLMFSVPSYWAIFSGVVISGLAEGFLLRSFMALTRLVPVVRYESSYAVIGLVSEMGLIAPIVFREVVDMMEGDSHTGDAAKESRLARLAAQWTVLTVVCGIVTYFCVPKDMKQQYLTWKDVCQDRSVKEVSNEMKRQMLIYKEMQNRGASMSDYTYEYCEEEDQYGTSALSQSPLLTFTDPATRQYGGGAAIASATTGLARMSTAIASAGGSVFQNLFGNYGTGSKPYLVNYRSFWIQGVNWRVKIRHPLFFYSITVYTVNLAWRCYTWMFLEEALHEFALINTLNDRQGVPTTYHTWSGDAYTATDAVRQLRLLTYILPLSTVFAFISTKTANLTIQFDLWVNTALRIFTTACFCVGDPKWKFIGMVSWPMTYTFAHSETRVFVRELFGNYFVYFIEFVSGVTIFIMVIFMDQIEDYFNIPSKLALHGNIMSAFVDAEIDDVPFDEGIAQVLPDRDVLLSRNRGFLYIGLVVIFLNCWIPIIRSYIDRQEYMKTLKEKGVVVPPPIRN